MKRFLPAIALLPTLLINAAHSAEVGEHTRGIIGVLPLPEVFGSEPCDHFKPQDIQLFNSPGASKHMGRIYLSRPWTFPPSGGCEGLEVSVALDGAEQRVEALPTLEFSYENSGAVVRNRNGEWFEIALISGYAWVRIKDAGSRYVPVEKLLKESLAYLSGDGPITLLSSPGHGKAIWSRSPHDRNNLSVEITSFQKMNGKLWVQVKILDVDPCTEESTGIRPISGWLPFHYTNGMPSVWFYSRGC